MAPAARHPSSIVQLGPLLAESRRQGLSFGEAWELAIRPRKSTVLTTTADAPAGAVRWPSDADDRRVQRTAILATVDEWRRAYERRPPTARECAVTVLVSLLPELAAAADRPDGLRLPFAA